jgi:predicted ATP-grasp superfamily ATP-dependent carboligase
MLTSLQSRSPDEGAAVLIAAQSGRSLAAAARRAGYRPLVADLFGDSDTRDLAEDYRQVTGRFGVGIAGNRVLSALEQLALSAKGALLGVVLGSGFERSPKLIEAIAERFRLIGATAGTVARLKDPAEFASTLARLEIPHPPIRLLPVGDSKGWLAKRRGGSGGGHIRFARPDLLAKDSYLQKRMQGDPVSIAFLADGQRALIIARTLQWTSPSPRSGWRYGGAIEPGGALDVGPDIQAALDRIVPAFGLRGLASADLLIGPDGWWLLEINPRPGATLDCLDRRATPLFQRHYEASMGYLGTEEEPPDEAAGTMIVYAHRRVSCVPDIRWPAFVMDRPVPGTAIPVGAPICTLSAYGVDAEKVRATLEVRGRHIVRLLQDGNASRDWFLGASEHQRADEAVG